MRFCVAGLAALFTSGCVFTVDAQRPGDDGSSSNAMAVSPEPDYTDAAALIDAATGKLEGDPAAAERDFLAARAALFRAYDGMHAKRGFNRALYEALARTRHFGPAANEILWRSVIGRTAALQKLGRDTEALTEIPQWDVEAGFDDGRPHSGGFTEEQWAKMHKKVLPAIKLCPQSLGSACAGHVAWLEKRFPQVEVFENGIALAADLTLSASNESALAELPATVKELPDQPIVIALTLAASKREKDGSVTLIRDGAEVAVTSQFDTGKRRLAIEDDRVVVKREMTTLGRDVSHSNSISIHLAPDQEFARGQVSRREIIVYANLKKTRTTREGPRTRYHLDKPFVISLEGSYHYGVDIGPAAAPAP